MFQGVKLIFFYFLKFFRDLTAPLRAVASAKKRVGTSYSYPTFLYKNHPFVC